jgi:hypothetical protein
VETPFPVNTSWVFGHRLGPPALLGSMGRVASSVDNSMIESFWSTMQRTARYTILGGTRRLAGAR